MLGDAGVTVFSAEDLDAKCTEIVCIKGVLESAELVQNTPHGPHVGLVVVLLVLAKLCAGMDTTGSGTHKPTSHKATHLHKECV